MLLTRFAFFRRRVLLAGAAASLAACADQIPTVVGDDAFPAGGRLGTFQTIVPAAGLVSEIGRFDGYTDARDAPFLLVANQFDGSLEANTLVRFTDAPLDSAVLYDAGTLIARIDTAASALVGTTLQLWTLDQGWDPETVTWERATESEFWRQPGGTRARLVSEIAAPAEGDSLLLPVDSAEVRRVASEEHPGLLVTATGAAGRVQLVGRFSLRTTYRTAASPDSAIARTLSGGPQRFVFTPAPPQPATAWPAGGIRSARTLFRLTLPQRVAAPGGEVALRDVTINSAFLLLRPLPVPNGFRPLAPVPLGLRTVFETELGRRSLLGDPVQDGLGTAAGAIFPPAFFMPGDSLVAIPVTQLVTRRIRSDSTGVSLALLAEPEPAGFGVAWFEPAPRLRIVYTLPARPLLP
ncbi:MAG: hypothetical protein M3409_11145 [Gemmatimonadota bacterium]|nr:hypothetical protein [Gemmatimonadota bacterium]